MYGNVCASLEATHGLVIPQVLVPSSSDSIFGFGTALDADPLSSLDPLFPIVSSEEQLLYQSNFDWGQKYTPANPLRIGPYLRLSGLLG